jgi:YVTN family beta-propeller protein
MKQSHAFSALILLLLMHQTFAAPGAEDRVYTADQNSNTVSVINPATDTLLGQIKLGNQRPDILSPLYKGEVNVHGLGFSPDHRTLIAISNGSNAVTFIDTASNKVKGTAYIGRSPHEGFFTADSKEVWVVVRGEDYISVIDPRTFKETRRIATTPGPGMVLFHPNGKQAFMVSSFNPVVHVIDVPTHAVVKRMPVVSPFSPFLQFTPDFKEVWMTHKDVGKVTRTSARSNSIGVKPAFSKHLPNQDPVWQSAFLTSSK